MCKATPGAHGNHSRQRFSIARLAIALSSAIVRKLQLCILWVCLAPLPVLAGESCVNIKSVDFGNHVFATPDGTLTLRGGLYEEKHLPDPTVEWRSEIEADFLMVPAPFLTIRVIKVYRNHLTGSGAYGYVFGFRCKNGRIQTVFTATPRLYGPRVEKVSEGELQLRFGEWASSDPTCCPSRVTTQIYRWNGARQRFDLARESSTSNLP